MPPSGSYPFWAAHPVTKSCENGPAISSRQTLVTLVSNTPLKPIDRWMKALSRLHQKPHFPLANFLFPLSNKNWTPVNILCPMVHLCVCFRKAKLFLYSELLGMVALLPFFLTDHFPFRRLQVLLSMLVLLAHWAIAQGSRRAHSPKSQHVESLCFVQVSCFTWHEGFVFWYVRILGTKFWKMILLFYFYKFNLSRNKTDL